MISDPKLPFAGGPAGIETSARLASEHLSDTPSERTASGSGESIRRPSGGKSLASAARVWLHRIGVLLFVFMCATLGVMLMILPWRPEWTDNPLLLMHPSLHSLLSSGFVRGVVTGLGLINIWIGFWEAIAYREEE
jgi:hypothetical protein